MNQDSGLKNGPISANQLMENLARASKVMNKIEPGVASRPSQQENSYYDDDDNVAYGINESETYLQGDNFVAPQAQPQRANTDRISQSKLPDAIKKAMMENPIPQISLTETLDLDFVKKAKALMERDNGGAKKVQPKPQAGKPMPAPTAKPASNDLIKQLKPVIETIVEKTIERVLTKKLNELMEAQQGITINENLAIRVGESIFSGKITKVKQSK